MIRNDGVNRTHPYQFYAVSNAKFILILISSFLMAIIAINYKNHIYTSLGIEAIDEKNKDYKHQKKIFWGGWGVLCFLLVIDLAAILSGLTYNSNKINAVNLILKFFISSLLVFYWVDDWQCLSIVYIMIFEFFSAGLEVLAFINSCCFEYNKYDRIRQKKIKFIEKIKKD